MTAIEQVEQRPATVPGGEWGLMVRQAEALAQSDIIPRDYRRKPANVLVAAMTGRHFGWDVLTAMRNGHVIEGTWGMKPEAMVGLVRQAGHSVTSDISAEGATVVGVRADTGDTMTVSFTLEDARRAGLANKGTWKSYPQMMCHWRATAMLCRMLFSDITAGVHSAEELGGSLDADGNVSTDEPIEPPAPMPLSDEAWQQFVKACEDHDIDPNVVLVRAFGEDRPDELTDAHLPAMRDAFKALVAEADVVEAEVVEDAGVTEVRPATRGQVGAIKGEYAKLGIEDRDEQLSTTYDYIGRDVETHNDLTYDEAALLLDELRATNAIPDMPDDLPDDDGDPVDGEG